MKMNQKFKNFFQLTRTLLNIINLPYFISFRKKSIRNLKFLVSTYGGEILQKKRLQKIKKSDTIFILACGSSINNLSEDKLQFISRHDSISIGPFWYHEFIPKFCLVEISDFPKDGYRQTKFLLNKLKQCSFKYSKTLFLFKLRVPHDEVSRQLYEFVSKNHLFNWIDTRVIFTRKKTNLLITLYILKLFGIFQNNLTFLQYNGSLIWSILFSYKLGYKKIVLCGVDLQGNYFFDKNNNENKSHSSLIKSNFNLNLDKAVQIINNFLLKRDSISLYKQGNSRAFRSELPEFTEWD